MLVPTVMAQEWLQFDTSELLGCMNVASILEFLATAHKCNVHCEALGVQDLFSSNFESVNVSLDRGSASKKRRLLESIEDRSHVVDSSRFKYCNTVASHGVLMKLAQDACLLHVKPK